MAARNLSKETMKTLTHAFKVSNVSSAVKIEDGFKCKLCHCILFDPVKCSKCNLEFCNHCFVKFNLEVGTCPQNC